VECSLLHAPSCVACRAKKNRSRADARRRRRVAVGPPLFLAFDFCGHVERRVWGSGVLCGFGLGYLPSNQTRFVRLESFQCSFRLLRAAILPFLWAGWIAWLRDVFFRGYDIDSSSHALGSFSML
jgi:hypothetical protein